MSSPRQGVVSVILVNFRGAPDTIVAVQDLQRLEWPTHLLEIIVVENGSGDDSLPLLKSALPGVLIVESSKNLGFAGGCNLGVEKSSGEFVAFLNSDAKPDARWVSAAVERFAESPAVGAVASRVLDWEGENVDFVGAAMTWFGMGYKPYTTERFTDKLPVPSDVLFGTGSAMFVRRSVFDELGGFDESYFMFFEDVDLGWRLALLGHRYVYEPESLAFHKHHGSMGGFGSFKEQYLLERNALFTLYKNLDDEHLAEVLPAAMALSVRRGVANGGLDSASLDLRRAGGDSEPMTEVSKQTLSSVFAIDQFVERLPELKKARAAVQGSRRVTDARVWKLFGQVDAPSSSNSTYLEGYKNLVSTFDVLGTPATTRVLIITGDPIGKKLAGPAVRAWNMAETLAQDHLVTLLSLSGVERLSAPFDLAHVRPGDDRAFAPFEAAADVIIFQGHAMAVFAPLRTSRKILVVDVYDPMHLEQLEQGRELPPATWAKQVSDATDVLNEQLLRGDFFLAASERQRHFYLGQLAALGRINPSNYAGDPDLEGLIDIVPFGLSSTPPIHARDVLKGVIPGIGFDDKVLIWSGGLYNWFDPETLIRAVAALSTRRPGVRLYFQGTKHPHPGVPVMEIVAQSQRLASELAVLNTSVFFNESWVDYAERGNYLTEADAGVSTHFSHIETTFSFRTRILDYLWAGLPMVVTDGDHFAELIRSERLGIVVPAEDVGALTVALETVLFDEEFIREAKANIERVRTKYQWSEVLAPLVAFVADPRHAHDNADLGKGGARSISGRLAVARRTGLRHDVGLVMHHLANGGPRVVFGKIRGRLRRR